MKKHITILLLFGMIFVSAISAFAKPKVEYEGEKRGLIAVPDDFFSEFGTIMPGDKKEEFVTVVNTEKSSVEIYFRTKLEEDLQKLFGTIKNPKTERERAAVLLEQIKLRIELAKGGVNKTIYEGNLAATTLKDGVSLGKYNSGEEGQLNFQIEIPKELGNLYASSNTDVIWIFSVNSVTSPSSEERSSEKENLESKESTENKKDITISNNQDSTLVPSEIDKRESSDTVILGISDYSWILGIILMISGILGVTWLMIRRKKQ